MSERQLKCRNLGTYPGVEIYYTGGGPVPDALSGHYTSIVEAEKAIKSFQKSVQLRVAKNAKGRTN